MAILYDILERKELDQYPPLSNWVLDTVKSLMQTNNEVLQFNLIEDKNLTYYIFY
jgi:hypothetical protein